ncbi:hypothetical protein HDU84_005174 [Entophlyctis sp. JEL0112]|nr:hypothetical protein HDU84_005174 [Entophlyctis sp. JEL0112]
MFDKAPSSSSGGERDCSAAALDERRRAARSRLEQAWLRVFEKYGRDLSAECDEIEVASGEVVVDRGHFRTMPMPPFGGGRSAGDSDSREDGSDSSDDERSSSDDDADTNACESPRARKLASYSADAKLQAAKINSALLREISRTKNLVASVPPAIPTVEFDKFLDSLPPATPSNKSTPGSQVDILHSKKGDITDGVLATPLAQIDSQNNANLGSVGIVKREKYAENPKTVSARIRKIDRGQGSFSGAKPSRSVVPGERQTPYLLQYSPFVSKPCILSEPKGAKRSSSPKIQSRIRKNMLTKSHNSSPLALKNVKHFEDDILGVP